MAARFTPVKAKGIQVVVFMEKTLDRGPGDDSVMGADQDWLAQLVVPWSEIQPVALETIQGQGGAGKVRAQGHEVGCCPSSYKLEQSTA